jgi:PEGA domain-containing protein
LRRLSLFLVLFLAAAMGLLATGASAADTYFMDQSVYGYSGYSPGGSLYINALPSDAEVRLDGVLIGQANDLQARPVEAHAGVHTLTFQAEGYEPASVLVRVVRDWTTRVRLTLIPSR